jgi:hypothetical protein
VQQLNLLVNDEKFDHYMWKGQQQEQGWVKVKEGQVFYAAQGNPWHAQYAHGDVWLVGGAEVR